MYLCIPGVRLCSSATASQATPPQTWRSTEIPLYQTREKTRPHHLPPFFTSAAKRLFSAVLASVSTMETRDSFGGADSVNSRRSRSSSYSSEKSQSHLTVLRVPPQTSHLLLLLCHLPPRHPFHVSQVRIVPRMPSLPTVPTFTGNVSVPSPSQLASLPTSPLTGDSVDVSSPTSLSVHSLRSHTQYSNRENQLFLNAIAPFLNKTPISEEA